MRTLISQGQGENKTNEEICFEIAKDVMRIPEVKEEIAKCMIKRGLAKDKLDEYGKTYCDGFLDGSSIMLEMIISGKLEIQIAKTEV